MFKLLIVLFSLVLVLSGCLKRGEIKLGACPVVEVPVIDCNQVEILENPVVDVEISDDGASKGADGKGGGRVAANPPNVCVEPGSTVKFVIKGVGTEYPGFAVLPKRFDDTWLVAGSAENDGTLSITVPADLADSSRDKDNDGWSEYNYSIVTSEGACVDPRFHVRN